jgi:hypothetical protein
MRHQFDAIDIDAGVSCQFFHAASTAFGYSGRPRLPL